MTSVASWDKATTAGNYTLTFSGMRVGNWVEHFNSEHVEEHPLNTRHNFWDEEVILDRRYPAVSYEHTITVYTENNTLEGFISDFYGFVNSLHQGDVAPIKIEDGDTGTVVVSFGSCYFTKHSLEEPSNLLRHRAGFVRLTFAGNVSPTVST